MVVSSISLAVVVFVNIMYSKCNFDHLYAVLASTIHWTYVRIQDFHLIIFDLFHSFNLTWNNQYYHFRYFYNGDHCGLNFSNTGKYKQLEFSHTLAWSPKAKQIIVLLPSFPLTYFGLQILYCILNISWLIFYWMMIMKQFILAHQSMQVMQAKLALYRW